MFSTNDIHKTAKQLQNPVVAPHLFATATIFNNIAWKRITTILSVCLFQRDNTISPKYFAGILHTLETRRKFRKSSKYAYYLYVEYAALLGFQKGGRRLLTILRHVCTFQNVRVIIFNSPRAGSFCSTLVRYESIFAEVPLHVAPLDLDHMLSASWIKTTEDCVQHSRLLYRVYDNVYGWPLIGGSFVIHPKLFSQHYLPSTSIYQHAKKFLDSASGIHNYYVDQKWLRSLYIKAYGSVKHCIRNTIRVQLWLHTPKNNKKRFHYLFPHVLGECLPNERPVACTFALCSCQSTAVETAVLSHTVGRAPGWVCNHSDCPRPNEPLWCSKCHCHCCLWDTPCTFV